MSPQSRIADPIRETTVRTIAHEIFAELYRRNHVQGITQAVLKAQAEELLDTVIGVQHRLPTSQDVRDYVQEYISRA
jgi:hypothetical protein